MNRRQTIPKELRYTINDFNRQFPDDNACIEHLKEQRFPGGIAYCGNCRQEQKHHRIKGRPVYACDVCLTQISPMAGTIFEHSSTSLRLWYYAMYLMASTRCGVSAKQIQRETGVTYKTAWRMFKQIRSMLVEDGDPFGGKGGKPVEMDETYIGGKRRNGSKGRTDATDKIKTPVFGIVERKGRVVAYVTPNVKKETIMGVIKERVLPSSMVFTDDYCIYDDLGRDRNESKHNLIRHSEKVYVVGD